MNERDKQILYHIRKNCSKIIDYHTRFGDNYESFKNDNAYQDAVSMCIMQVGELANGFTDEFKNDVDFPFKEIRGMRNFLAHNYIKADTLIVWNTSKTDIPSLLTKCTSLIEQTKKEE